MMNVPSGRTETSGAQTRGEAATHEGSLGRASTPRWNLKVFQSVVDARWTWIHLPSTRALVLKRCQPEDVLITACTQTLVSGSDLASMGSFFVGFTYGIGKVDATHNGYCQTSLRDGVIRDWCGIAEAHHQ